MIVKRLGFEVSHPSHAPEPERAGVQKNIATLCLWLSGNAHERLSLRRCRRREGERWCVGDIRGLTVQRSRSLGRNGFAKAGSFKNERSVRARRNAAIALRS